MDAKIGSCRASGVHATDSLRMVDILCINEQIPKATSQEDFGSRVSSHYADRGGGINIR